MRDREDVSCARLLRFLQPLIFVIPVYLLGSTKTVDPFCTCAQVERIRNEVRGK